MLQMSSVNLMHILAGGGAPRDDDSLFEAAVCMAAACPMRLLRPDFGYLLGVDNPGRDARVAMLGEWLCCTRITSTAKQRSAELVDGAASSRRLRSKGVHPVISFVLQLGK